jgi:hypothetical protein
MRARTCEAERKRGCERVQDSEGEIETTRLRRERNLLRKQMRKKLKERERERERERYKMEDLVVMTLSH